MNNVTDAPVGPQAQKILGFIEAAPYQGQGSFHLICQFKDEFKDADLSDDNFRRYKAIVRQCLKELKAANLIYRSTATTYGDMWVATCHRSWNEEFDGFINNGKARSLLRNLEIKKIDELCRFTANDLMKINGCGRKTVSLIAEALQKRGLNLAPGFDQRAIWVKKKLGGLPDEDVLFILRRKSRGLDGIDVYSWAYYFENEIEEVIEKLKQEKMLSL